METRELTYLNRDNIREFLEGRLKTLKGGYDYIIIGGGIAGSFLALELSKSSKVLLIDKGPLLGGATGSSAEIITLQLPKPFINWALESIKIYEEIGAPLKRMEAILATNEKCAERYLKILNSVNVKSWILTRSEASRESGLTLKGSNYVYLATLDALLEVGKLGNLMRLLLTSNNADIIEYKEAKIKDEKIKIGEEFIEPTQAIIVAGGAWTPYILNIKAEELAGSRIYKCEAHSIDLGKKLKTIFYEDLSGAYMVPESSKTATVGDGTNVAISKPEDGFVPTPGSVYEVLEGLSRAVADVENAIPRTSWAAPCLISGDGWPIVGNISERTYIFTGFDGVGLMIAPALARMLSAHLLKGRKLPQKIYPLRKVKPWEGPPKEPPEPYRFGC